MWSRPGVANRPPPATASTELAVVSELVIGVEVVAPSVFTGTAVGLGVLVTLVLGIVPEPVLSLANHAANQLFVG